MTVNTETKKVLILGAGIAGLSCARELQHRGIPVRVLERSQVPGGRCAHRDGFDFGPIFLHGSHREFLDLRHTVPAQDLLEGWPRRVEGRGKPCQPSAFLPGSLRWAFGSGMGALTGQLARDLDLRLGFQAHRILRNQASWTVISQEGEEEEGSLLVLAMAPEQTRELLRTLPEDTLKDLGSPQALLELFSTVPSLTLRVRWKPEALETKPRWDVLYPEDSQQILLISRESSKRPSPSGTENFVIQARPSWSGERVSRDKGPWTRELLEATRPYLKASGAPIEVEAHRWKHARLEPGQHLARSWISRSVPSLAMTGELFHPAGGLEGAWLAGKALAENLSWERKS